ncbi:bifunctional metallophosphatase/5'-nucleotidase [Humidesulfovibrio sp.]
MPGTVLRPIAQACILALALALASCAQRGQPLRLTVAHVNDTHSALEPVDEALVLHAAGANQRVRAKLGGMARLKTALDAVRAKGGNVLFLHAGDAVQGTLYFNLFQGAAEFEFLNALGVDAMCLGNHEFDKGPAQLARMLTNARFPVLASNVDASGEPDLAQHLQPYVIRHFAADTGREYADGEPPRSEAVAIIGSTTPTTPLISMDVGRVRFAKPAPVLRKLVRELESQGVNKIILLSHNGYEADLALAHAVPGLDVIVGGHSHTLLGDAEGLSALGLAPSGPYPTRVDGPAGAPVLVVQAWKWGEALGELAVEFDAAGRIAGHHAAQRLVAGQPFSQNGQPVDPDSPLGAALRQALLASNQARLYDEDPALLAKLAPYAEQVAAFQNAPLGVTLQQDLVRGTATDPGPLVADALLAMVPGAQVSMVGGGGLRKDLPAGPLTLGQVMGVLPFGNTLVAMDITGAQIKAALEDAVEFRLSARPPAKGDLHKLVLLHTGGLSYVIHPLRPKGGRVSALTLHLPGAPAKALDPAATYRLVTNSFLANGGDGLHALKTISASRIDTGLLEHDALAQHLVALGKAGPIAPPAGPRVVVDTTQ